MNDFEYLRNNLSLLLLSDLIGADTNELINWNKYVVTILHMCILTLDSPNPLICFHSRRSIINCCLVYSKTLNSHYASKLATIILTQVSLLIINIVNKNRNYLYGKKFYYKNKNLILYTK